jgi:hypothetical protein
MFDRLNISENKFWFRYQLFVNTIRKHCSLTLFALACTRLKKFIGSKVNSESE